MIPRFQARQMGNPNKLFGKILAAIWNRRNAALNNAAFEQLDLQTDDRVLEVGFGSGYLMNRMASVINGGILAGIDISQGLVTAGKNRFRSLIPDGKVDLVCARAEHLPYNSGFFTIVCSVNSIFYWDDVPQALTELWRVLRSRGKFVLCQTNPKSLKSKGFASYVNRYEVQDLNQMLEKVGFQGISIFEGADRYREYSCISGKKLTEA